jgi:hypothetical protein
MTRCARSGSRRTLFDQRVGALLQGQRYFKAQFIGGLEIDHQFVFDRGLHGKLAWLLALENAISIARRAAEIINLIISVGQKAAFLSEGAEWIDAREPVVSRQ